MYLKTLRLKGFKSFAKTVTLNFGPGLSVIVGPNGTGKSNIVDAILWVLGEQNPRFLRGQSMQDVIFAGTDKLSPAPLAEVTLIFDNSLQLLPLNTAEVSIKRLVSRDGTSAYFINEKPCRLIDIKELIAHMNLGSELPGIVPQNRVYELINPNSSDLKAIIEEASGIGFYRLRRENAVKKLKNADEKLEKIHLLLNEVNSQLRPLKKQAEALKQVLELKKQADELENKKLLAGLLELREKVAEIEKEISFLDSDIEKTNLELESLEAKRKFLEASLEKENQPLKQLQKFRQLKDYSSKFEFIKLLVEEKARNLLDKITSLRQQLTSSEAAISGMKAKLETLTNQSNEISQKRESLKGLIEVENLELNKIKTKKHELSVKLQKINDDLREVRTERDRLIAKISLVKKEIELKKEETEKTEKEIHKAKNILSELTLSLEEKQKIKAELEKELKTRKLEYQAKKEDSEKFQEKVKELENMLNGLNLKKAQLEKELNELKVILSRYNRDFRKVDEVITLTDYETYLLRTVLPYEQPLSLLYPEDLEVISELPPQFILTQKGNEETDFKNLITKIENQKKEIVLNSDDVFYHPSGFYYRPQNSQSYYALISRIKNMESELRKYEKKRNELLEEFASKDKEMQTILDELKTIALEIDSKKAKVDQLNLEIKLTQEKIAFYEKDLTDRKNRNHLLAQERQLLTENLDKFLAELNKVDERLKTFEHEKASVESEITALKETEKKAVNKIEANKKALSDLEFELKQLQAEKERVERELNKTLQLLRVSSAGVEHLESKIHFYSEIHGLVENYLEAFAMMLSASSSLESIEETIKNYTRSLNELNEKQKSLYERITRIETRKEILRSQKEQMLLKIEETVNYLEAKNKSTIENLFKTYQIDQPSKTYEEKYRQIKAQLDNIGDYNPFALRDYELLKERADFLKKQASDIKEALKNLQVIIEEVDRKIIKRFEEALGKLNDNFNRLYNLLTIGGSASITVDTKESLEEASFIIEVRQPGKKLKNINLLSGGEKALASLSLLLALEETFEVPFMVLDEVEPALDEVNLQRLVAYLKKAAEKTQIIMITHQPLTVEAADTIYGVTVDRDGSSRVYSLKISEVDFLT
jgi:chromosome segregation protein